MPDTNISTSPTIRKISTSIKEALEPKVDPESQVIVHCSIMGSNDLDLIRIWPSTFLFDNHSDHKSEMVHHENITLYPTWTDIEYQKIAHFTLVFTGLPKTCSSFNLIEVIPQAGGFVALNIVRNETDVYRVMLE